MAEPLVLRSDGPLARSRSHRVRVARTQQAQIAMAVPKKRQSKMKTRQRKANVRAPTGHERTVLTF